MVEDYPRTPSLTNSEETISSGSELPLPKSLTRLSPNHAAPSFVKEKKSTIPRVSIQIPRPVSTYFSKHPSRSSLLNGSVHRFVTTWSHPTILRSLLSCLGWREFHAVTRTCRAMRALFSKLDARNVVLSRFVPGYSLDARDVAEVEVRVTVSDLEALMLSQSLPLHRYPMHAVYIVSALNGIPPQAQDFTDRLIRLAQAHSRFVLILRSRAPRWQVTSDPDDFIRRTNLPPALRELTFPAPLSYFGTAKEKKLPLPPLMPSSLKKKRNSQRRPHSDEDPPPSPRACASGKRRMSIFGRSKERIPLPEPRSSLPSVKYYSSLGRARRTTTMSATDDESGPTFNRHSRFMTDSLPPPRYPFASRSPSSPNSSVGSLTRSATSPVQSSMSPHDISNALTRTRAPILRVFVPCSTLTSPDVLAAIEDQLFEGGLWAHLHTGDVVCNLGYVPEDSNSARGWLVFDGDVLSPFFPPASPPVPDMTALPSPLYFSHLLPPLDNPRCILGLPRGMRMNLHLAFLSSNVPSPHSHSGHARVKRYMWLGRVVVKEDETEALGVGDGWAGEWVLEAEGTKEGKQVLVDAIEENDHRLVRREWEVIREKSGAGRVWLRLTPEHRGLDDLSAELSNNSAR